MKKYLNKILFSILGLIALGTLSYSQVATTSGFWSNWPIVGSASYSCGSVNGFSNCTVAAGPTVVTGNETIPANSGQAGSTNPQNVLLGLASLNALPVTVQVVTISGSVAAATSISAANLSGGVLYTSTGTITSAGITLPLSPVDGQQYRVSSNQTITTLAITAPAGTSMGTNTNPTVLTASLTAPQGYTFRYNAADTKWYRMQ